MNQINNTIFNTVRRGSACRVLPLCAGRVQPSFR